MGEYLYLFVSQFQIPNNLIILHKIGLNSMSLKKTVT